MYEQLIHRIWSEMLAEINLHVQPWFNIFMIIVCLCSMNQLREQVKKEDVTVKSKSSHHSQTDAAKGFGGKYGVMKERQDKVC